MFLIMPENARINGSNYARALNMPRYIYNNINRADKNSNITAVVTTL